MEITIINDIEGLVNIQQSWENLENRAEHITVYNSYRYIYSWAKQHQSFFEELFVVCVSERKDIIGIAPLMVTKSRALSLIKFKRLSFLGKGDFFNFLIENRTNTKPIISKIFEIINKADNWDKLDLTHIRKESALLKYLLRTSIYNNKTSFFGENPIVIKNNHTDFADYKKLHIRKNVNNYNNKLRKDYDVQVKIYWDNEADILNRISKIHIERNSSGKKRKSLFTQSKTWYFLKSIYSSQGKKTLTFCIENENEIISYVSCFVYGEIIHAWNNSYNINFEKYSPGDIIYMEAMKYFFSENSEFGIFDFGGGRYPWKFQMTNDFISMYRLDINNKNANKYLFLQWYDKVFQIGKIVLKK